MISLIGNDDSAQWAGAGKAVIADLTIETAEVCDALNHGLPAPFVKLRNSRKVEELPLAYPFVSLSCGCRATAASDAPFLVSVTRREQHREVFGSLSFSFSEI